MLYVPRKKSLPVALDTSTNLAVEVRKGADDLADANDEEGGKGWRYHIVVERRHKMVLNLQAQLRCVQKWIAKVVAGAEHQDVGHDHRAILEQGNILLSSEVEEGVAKTHKSTGKR